LIDLHMHSTASDGRCTPEELVDRVARAGITTMSLTDHDTLGGIQAATAAATLRGIEIVPGIEITSVHRGKDVHVLAYFVSEHTPGLQDLLVHQRKQRLDRALEIAARLARLGAPLDTDALVATATAPGGKALARPQIAEMLIAAGHVKSVPEAFERYLGEDSPAYVPHTGASPAEVVSLVTKGGGAASLAHPGYRGAGPTTPKDELVPQLVDAGLTAIEAVHSSHDPEQQAHYVKLAREHGLAITGGSDYHGEGTRRAEFFGVIHLQRDFFDEFVSRAGARRTPSS
jgi:predicted metal-dependent phosphoesterase TrpH